MIELKPEDLTTRDLYKLLIGGIVPRPIAWVSTQSEEGKGNLAPFSFFMGVSSNPPCLAIAVGQRPDGSTKDTLRNIKVTKEFVVNSATLPLAEALVATAAEHEYGIDELQEANLEALPSVRVAPVRVKGSPVHFECRVKETLQIGEGQAGSSTLVVGEIVYAHIEPAAYESGRIDHRVLEPLARLGGFGYAELGRSFELKVPPVKP